MLSSSCRTRSISPKESHNLWVNLVGRTPTKVPHKLVSTPNIRLSSNKTSLPISFRPSTVSFPERDQIWTYSGYNSDGPCILVSNNSCCMVVWQNILTIIHVSTWSKIPSVPADLESSRSLTIASLCIVALGSCSHSRDATIPLYDTWMIKSGFSFDENSPTAPHWCAMTDPNS